ncbi:MAG: Holliday junction resolvase RuvX [Alphaproteobacteria bacterium]
MPIVTVPDLPTRLARNQRLMGLDLGTKTIGLAISDPGLSIASPLDTLARGKFHQDLERLMRHVRDGDVGGLVLGLPVNMDGSEGPRCQATRAFADNLLARHDLPLAFWDERLSTAAVERMLIAEADLSRRRRAEVVDKLAAAYILQGALDHIKAQAST